MVLDILKGVLAMVFEGFEHSYRSFGQVKLGFGHAS